MKYKLLKTITGMMDHVIFFLDKSLLKKQPIDNYYSLYKKNLNQSFYFRVNEGHHRTYKTFKEEKYSHKFRFKFFVAKDKNNKVNELLISTTFIDIKEKPHSRWEEKINELVKLGLVYISKDKKSGQIKSIKTNKKCNILNLKKIKGFSYQKIGLGDIVSELQSDETFKSVAKEMGEENIIKSYFLLIFRLLPDGNFLFRHIQSEQVAGTVQVAGMFPGTGSC